MRKIIILQVRYGHPVFSESLYNFLIFPSSQFLGGHHSNFPIEQMFSMGLQLMHVQNTNRLGMWTFPFIVQMRGSSIWVFSFGKKGGKWREVPNRYTTETFSSVGLILANVRAKAWVLQAMNILSLIACLISLINNSVQSKNQSCKVMSSGARVYSKILQNLPFMHY